MISSELAHLTTCLCFVQTSFSSVVYMRSRAAQDASLRPRYATDMSTVPMAQMKHLVFAQVCNHV